ncbi:MAG: FxLYD domain-containing protein, partial [Dehalococcoidia bacterium]
ADVAQSSATVEGQAQNMLAWPLDNCKICVTFYDYAGNSLGVYSDSIGRFEPGKVWSFKIALRGNDAWKVARYDITVCN